MCHQKRESSLRLRFAARSQLIAYTSAFLIQQGLTLLRTLPSLHWTVFPRQVVSLMPTLPEGAHVTIFSHQPSGPLCSSVQGTGAGGDRLAHALHRCPHGAADPLCWPVHCACQCSRPGRLAGHQACGKPAHEGFFSVFLVNMCAESVAALPVCAESSLRVGNEV